ncbi:MAG: hypothetical protein J6X18_17470 [Bacteroidales bacterium]|nr:hypothetical protein [Bacteroidales bacterium]
MNDKNKEGYLTTDWTSISYQEIKNNRAGSKEMLGINSIQITFDAHMYPRVTMNFTDVRGSALMEPQEQRNLDLHGNGIGDDKAVKNFFVNFFKFPYPRFLLSVKGVYGTCVTFVLSVEDFRSTFNSDTGNFDTVVKFMGNMYGIYTDIPMNYLLIAPYIGSRTGGFAKNDYWAKQTSSDGAFFYNENGQTGQPIKTLLEFYSEYHTMIGPDGKGFASASGVYLSELGRDAREESFLTGSDGIITKYFDTIPANVKEGGQFLDGEPLGLKYNFIFFENDIDHVTFPMDFVCSEGEKNGFNPSVEAYRREFPDGYREVFENDSYNVSGLWKYKDNVSLPTRKIDLNDSRIFGKFGDWTEGDANILKSNLGEGFWEGKSRAYIYSNEVKFRAKVRVEGNKDDQAEKMEGAQKEIAKFFGDMFGFSPTIENIMRMIFAHLDTFIHEFYNVISQISGTRTLGSLNNFPIYLTDIESSSESSAHVPPYTAFFEKGRDGRIERIYPGNNKDTKGIAEVSFVNSIFRGIGSMQNWQEEFIKRYNEMYGESSDIDDGPIIEINFSATTPGDIFYKGKNPYDAFEDPNSFIVDLYNFIVYRAYSFCRRGNIARKKDFAKIEANNFLKSKAFNTFKKKDGFLSFVNKLASDTLGIEETTNTMKNMDVAKTLVLNGFRRPPENDEYAISKHSCVDILDGFSDTYVETFMESYPFKNESYTGLSTNYERCTFFFTNSGSTFGYPVIPLTYDGKKYVSSGESMFPNHYLKKVKVVGTNGETEEKDYGTLNNLLMNADESSLWIPYVCYGKPGKKYGENLLFNYKDSPIMSGANGTSEKRFAALYFIISLLSCDEKFSAKASLNRINNNIKFSGLNNTIKRVQKLDFLFLCGVAFIKTDESSAKNWWATTVREDFPFNGTDFDNMQMDSSAIERLSTYFCNWADSNFNKIVKAISGSTTSNTIDIQYQQNLFKKKEYGSSNYGTQFQSDLISLFKDNVNVIFINENVTNSTDRDIVNCVREILLEISRYLTENKNSEMPEETRENITIDSNIDTSEEMKSTVYYTLKNLYDRWLSMETSETFRLYSVEEETQSRLRKFNGDSNIAKDRSEFLNFAYVDSFYNDISKRFLVNPEKFFKLIGEQFEGEASYNVLDFIGRVCQDNKLLFRCLPVYSNVYNSSTFAEIFTPHSLYDGTSRIGRRIGNTYLIMYTYEPSHLLDIPQDKSEGVNYGNDSFDIADSTGKITQESLEVMKKKVGNGENNYSICAFGVTPGRQNQSYFTKVSVGMDSPRVTDFSIANKFQLAALGKRGGTINGVGVGQDLYSIYSNRSYDCTVEMLGCANIMPMMYFQLNNVPMFKGTYMITKVEHNIQNNAMTTKFVGTRMPKRYIPLKSSVFSIDSINAAMNRIAEAGDIRVSLGDLNITVGGISKEWSPDRNVGDVPCAKKENYEGKTFYLGNVESQMTQTLKYIINGTPGYQNPTASGVKSCHACATYAQYYLNAGFNGVIVTNGSQSAADAANITRVNNGFCGCNGYKMKYFLAENGFVPVAGRSKFLSDDFKPESGDVLVMNYPNYGHICVWSNTLNAWVSDFKQGTWHVGKEQSIGKSDSDVIVYRFGGARSSESFNYNEREIIKAKRPDSCS